MQTFLLIGLLFILLLLFVLINPKIEDVQALLTMLQPRRTLKNQARRQNREYRLVAMLRRTKTMMDATGQGGKFYWLLSSSLILLAIGFMVGTSYENYFLAPVLAIGFASVPFLYIRFQSIKYKKLVVEELETGLDIISVSYERTENILLAVEENLNNLEYPLRQVFEDFVRTIKYINPSIEQAIEQMKPKIDNSVFVEWCDALRRCASNRSLKYTLRPIVSKLTDIKIVSGEMKNLLYKSMRTYWELLAATVCVLVIGIYVIPLYMEVQLPATLVNILIAVNALLIVAATIRVMIESQDIKFDI